MDRFTTANAKGLNPLDLLVHATHTITTFLNDWDDSPHAYRVRTALDSGNLPTTADLGRVASEVRDNERTEGHSEPQGMAADMLDALTFAYTLRASCDKYEAAR